MIGCDWRPLNFRLGWPIISAGWLLANGLFPAVSGAEDPRSRLDLLAASPLEPSREEEEIAEARRLLRKLDLIHAAVDRIFDSSRTRDQLLDSLAVLFAERRYVRSQYAYAKLTDSLQPEDMPHLARAFQRAASVEAKIWFAAVADNHDDQKLLRTLAAELRMWPAGAARTRAAIAVAFKLGDLAMVPYLIESLSSEASCWEDELAPVGPAAAYLLTELTNQYFGPYPSEISNYSCFLNPPPVVPYPAPWMDPTHPRSAREAQPQWRKWWAANQDRPQAEWIREGIRRDVASVRGTPDLEQLDDATVARLRHFLGVDVWFDSQARTRVELAWKIRQREASEAGDSGAGDSGAGDSGAGR